MSMTEKEFLALLNAAAPNDFEDVDVGLGKAVPLRGATVSEYIRYLVRRFPSVRAQYTMGPRIAAKMMQELEVARKAAEAGGELFDEDAWQARYMPPIDQLMEVDGRIDSGHEADSALIAICRGMPGNRAVEKAIGDAPHAVFSAMLSAAQRKTWGDDPAGFSEEVSKALLGGALPASFGAPVVSKETASSES